MIRFNIDGATLVKVGSWQDIFERPDFRAPIVADGGEIEMIAQYAFPTLEPCGLKHCRTPHGKGYVVKVGNTGCVTNIGHICGRKHYGFQFELAKQRFETAVNAQRFRENIKERQNHLPGLRRRLQRLLDDESRQIVNKMNAHMTRYFDETTSRALKLKARQKDNRITRAVRLTEDEEEFEVGLRREAKYRTETVFLMSGIAAAQSYTKLSSAKLETLRCEIEAFSKLDADSLSFLALKANDRWAKQIDGKLDSLEAALLDCMRFLSADNIGGIMQHKHRLKGG